MKLAISDASAPEIALEAAMLLTTTFVRCSGNSQPSQSLIVSRNGTEQALTVTLG